VTRKARTETPAAVTRTYFIFLRGPSPLTARVLTAAGALKIISKNGAGIDSVDLACATARVDILSMHCSLTPQTRGMIGAKQFELMKPGAIVVNTARGKLIDQAAMIAALESGKLAGAGLIYCFAAE